VFTITRCPEGGQLHTTDYWHWHVTVSLPLLQECTICIWARPASTSLFHTTAKAAAVKQKRLKSIQVRPLAEQLFPVRISLHIQSHPGFSKLVTSLQIKVAAVVENRPSTALLKLRARYSPWKKFQCIIAPQARLGSY